MAEGGGIEPLGLSPHHGFQDRLSTNARHPLLFLFCPVPARGLIDLSALAPFRYSHVTYPYITSYLHRRFFPKELSQLFVGWPVPFLITRPCALVRTCRSPGVPFKHSLAFGACQLKCFRLFGMQLRVRRNILQYLQIADCIVGRVAVAMMYHLLGVKIPPQVLFHDKPVKQHVAIPVCGWVAYHPNS
jgi:hypothetical protein